MKYKLSGDTVLVSAYGLDTNADSLKEFYDLLVFWLKSIQCTPDKISVDGPGFSGEIISFKRGDSKLRKIGFSKVTEFSFYVLDSDAKIPLTQSRAFASVDFDTTRRKTNFTVSVRKPATFLDDIGFVNLQQDAVRMLRPKYGFSCEMPHQVCPQLYAVGLIYATRDEVGDDSNREEELAVNRWANIGMGESVFEQGIIREVYPRNYLAEVHLENSIDGQTLRSWITSNPSHGELQPVSNEITLWSVEVTQIPKVREALWSAGIIFNWRSYLPGMRPVV